LSKAIHSPVLKTWKNAVRCVANRTSTTSALDAAITDQRLSARHLDCHKRPILIPPRGSYQLKT
jgi:hypothetical protein